MAALLAVACTGCATGVTGPPTSVSDTGAQLAGNVVSDKSGPVEYWVEFGPTRSYGSATDHQSTDVTAGTPKRVDVGLSDLGVATSYHYRFCAQDSSQQGGPGCGEDRRLTTQTYGCGAVVTHDVRLTGNLLCSQTDGWTIGAAGVDVNLGGYTFDDGINVGGGGPIAIDDSGGWDDLTVRNGTLSGWGHGVFVSGGERTHVTNVDVSAANTGVTLRLADASEVANSNVFGRSAGISITDSPAARVTHTTANATFNSAISATGDLIVISNNTVVRGGVALTGDPAVALTGSAGRVSRNHVEGLWPQGILVQGANNTIADNEVFGATGDGILVGAFALHTRLVRNSAHDNGDDGIDSRDSTSSLGDNVANNNGDFGIDAAAGATDLGGNSASGNGNALQCRNVLCQ